MPCAGAIVPESGACPTHTARPDFAPTDKVGWIALSSEFIPPDKRSRSRNGRPGPSLCQQRDRCPHGKTSRHSRSATSAIPSCSPGRARRCASTTKSRSPESPPTRCRRAVGRGCARVHAVSGSPRSIADPPQSMPGARSHNCPVYMDVPHSTNRHHGSANPSAIMRTIRWSWIQSG